MHVFVERTAHDDKHTKKHKTTVAAGELPCLLALPCVTDDSIYAVTYTLHDPRLALKPTMIQGWMSRRNEWQAHHCQVDQRKEPEHK